MTAGGEETPGKGARKRLRSLDALRGFDMLWIVGLSQIFREWAKVSDAHWVQNLTAQLKHVDWAGLHAYDLIFPTFMFLSGISIPLALTGKTGGSKVKLLAGIWRRTAVLVLLGAVYNHLLDLDFANQRWASVLGQIGIAYGIAATAFVVTKGWKARAMVCGGILILIAVLQLLVPVPGHGAGVLTPEGIINGWVDRRFLPGRLNDRIFDPEGLLCIVSAAALTLGGVLAGSFLKSRGDTPRLSNVGIMAVAGAILFAMGVGCSALGYPPIKMAWNTPFNFFASGIALEVFALFYLLVDVIPGPNWSLPLQMVGMNPLTIYLANRLIPFAIISANLFGGLAGRTGVWKDTWLAVGLLAIEWLLLWFLYRRKIFLRV